MPTNFDDKPWLATRGQRVRIANCPDTSTHPPEWENVGILNLEEILKTIPKILGMLNLEEILKTIPKILGMLNLEEILKTIPKILGMLNVEGNS
jgi:hypothetical protein